MAINFEGFSTENKRLVQTITTTAETIQTDILETHSERLASRGGHFTAEQLIPVYFAAILGVPMDRDEQANFRNMLYNLREDLIKSPKLLLYIENELKPPSPEELAVFDGIDRTDMLASLCGIINIPGDEVRTRLAKEVLPEFVGKLNGETLLAAAEPLIVWLNRCLNSEIYRNSHTEIPILLYYGNVSPGVVQFLHFMSRLGFDVLYICGNMSMLPTLKRNNTEGRMQIFELPKSEADLPYPDKPVKTKLATAAYSASRDLNKILYGGDTFFKDFQFSDMEAVTLKTTYEEIDVLWHQPAKYRTGFAAEGDKVTVPTIFAKISGVKDGNLNAYWNGVKWKLSPNTKIMHKSPSTKRYGETRLDIYNPYFMGSKIQIEKLKNSNLNKYTYLSDSLQLLIFNKMQEAADSGFFKIDGKELVPLILYVGTNLDREILKLLQKYDFTKDIPKLVVIDVIEDTFSKVECVQLVLCSLLGFDIVIYTPTGYKNIETFVDDSAFETYTMNEFKYNVHIPKFKIPDEIPEPKDEGFFGRLFKKGGK
ncbi:MAG: YceG family protein [Ruminococcus sp.]|nr:YceG family protein [Ruminococcus sp.]MCM1381273.1 YceG family protein [Muribaculaceae bacterium]MCM1479213.1 YceG family protein [Muribaculaceae bacterium]